MQVQYNKETLYAEIIPYLTALSNLSYISKEDKKEQAINFVTESFIKAININESNNVNDLSRKDLAQIRSVMSLKEDISQIIYYLQHNK